MLVIATLPQYGDIILFIFPILIAFAIYHGYWGNFENNHTLTNSNSTIRHSISLPLVICSFLFAFSINVFIRDSSLDNTSTLSIVFLITTLVLILILWHNSTRRISLLVFIFAPILAGGVLLLPFLPSSYQSIVDILVNIARNLFSIYLYTSLAVIITRGNYGLFTIGITIGINDMGHVMGSLVKPLFNSAASQQILIICIVIAYLVLISTILLLYPTKLNWKLFDIPIKDNQNKSINQSNDLTMFQNDDSKEEKDLNNYLFIAAEEAGLSEREKQVLELLITSRTILSIANQLGISYNTAKTHTSHIFRKMNVKSREELLTLIDSYKK